MSELIVDLVPLALGIVLSPLAIMALVAVLLSERARVNGLTYLIGWAAAIAVILAISFGLLASLKPDQPAVTPTWVSVVKVVLGIGLIGAGVWQFRRGRAHLHAMARATTPTDVVQAAPQLPGWLKAVSTFTAFRTLLLGFGIFALNPVDLTCALLAGIDIRLAGLPPATSSGVLIAFGAVGTLPILVPVVLMVVLGRRADPVLRRIRAWIGGHSGYLNAGLLLVIGAMQLQKGLSALLG